MRYRKQYIGYNKGKEVVIQKEQKMRIHSHKAFTMIELTFVIVIIGILAAIALPRFSDTADSAYISKAQSQLAAVRSSLATERQRRIMRGDYSMINDLSLSSTGAATTNAFDHFSADSQGNFSPVVNYPIPACNGAQRGCWVKVDATHYSYRFPKAADGQADFVLNTAANSSNTLDCDNDTADCNLIIQ
jgi:general secretion pathway protein G